MTIDDSGEAGITIGSFYSFIFWNGVVHGFLLRRGKMQYSYTQGTRIGRERLVDWVRACNSLFIQEVVIYLAFNVLQQRSSHRICT